MTRKKTTSMKGKAEGFYSRGAYKGKKLEDFDKAPDGETRDLLEAYKAYESKFSAHKT